jgi:hypothetical protein
MLGSFMQQRRGSAEEIEIKMSENANKQQVDSVVLG